MQGTGKLTGFEPALLGYWTFDDAPAQFPYVWSDAVGARGDSDSSGSVMDAEIRILALNLGEDQAALLLLGASGSSLADADAADREIETAISLYASTSPSCAKATLRIVQLPSVGDIYDAVASPRGPSKGAQILSAGTDLTGSAVVFEIPTDLVTAATETTLAYVAWCSEGRDGVSSPSGSENVVEVTLIIHPSQPYPQLMLDAHLEHHLQMIEVVDPDEDEYNAVSTFSLTISGGQSLSASVETELTMAAATSQAPGSNGSVAALVVEGTGTSSEVNAILGATHVEANAENPFETRYRLDIVGGTPQDTASYEYYFGHELVRLPSISDIWPTEVPMTGSSVQVRGKNFAPGALCLVSDQIASEAAFVSQTRVLCEIPSQSATGILALAIALGSAAHERSNAVALTVTPTLELWDVQPVSGIVFPGSEIVVRGAPAFRNELASCRFVGLGGEQHRLVTPHVVAVDSIACRVPQVNAIDANSPFALEISQNLFDFFPVGTFSVFPHPVITRLSPSRGFRGLRAQVVDVLGMNFINSSHLECRIGPYVSPGVYVSPAKLQCVVLAGVHYTRENHPRSRSTSRSTAALTSLSAH